MKRIAIIPGDGIGVEVTREAVRVLETVGDCFGVTLELVHFDWGAEKYLRENVTLPEGALEMLRRDFDAVFTGAFGDPRVESNKHAIDILGGMRFGLDLYINFRPVRLLNDRFTPLKSGCRRNIDFVVFRENTEGIYVNAGGQFKRGTDHELAIQEEFHTRHGVERIIRAAFAYAREHGRKRVTLADKSNVLTHGHELWRRVFKIVAADYPEIEARAQYVDAMAMLMVLDPGQYEVIVTNNMFGDILTDLGAALQGGLGVAASANLHPGRTSLFEPVHGSAPDKAGQGIANPIGAIATVALMLDSLGYSAAARRVEEAIEAVCEAGAVTVDLGGTLSTAEAGVAICQYLRR
jgi:Isocitrate/isopropylmalate dehydrogenase